LTKRHIFVTLWALTKTAEGCFGAAKNAP